MSTDRLEPHHAAARQPTDQERYDAIKATTERRAATLAANGIDPAEATLAAYGQTMADDHRRRCPSHGVDRCVDDPGPNAADGRPRLEARRADVLARLRPAVPADVEQRAQRTVEHLRGDQ